MKRARTGFRDNRSGQLLIVAALAIALTVSSTITYVYDLNRTPGQAETSLSADFVLSLKQAGSNVVVSGLANVSNGGDRSVLAANAEVFSQTLRRLDRPETCSLKSASFNDSMYSSGVFLDWNASGHGLSSACVSFDLTTDGMDGRVASLFTVNVTTAMTLQGMYTVLLDGGKQLNLTCTVLNEERPALLESLIVYYEDLGLWAVAGPANNLTVAADGEGTYHVAFTAYTSSEPVHVLANVWDKRGIFVQTDVTCLPS